MRNLKTEALGTIKDDLEEVQVELENVMSIAHVCATSFDQGDAFSRMSEADVAGSFNLIGAHLRNINGVIDDALSCIYTPKEEEGTQNEQKL